MKIIHFGEYTLKASLVEMYRIETIEGDVEEKYEATLYLTNGKVIVTFLMARMN